MFKHELFSGENSGKWLPLVVALLLVCQSVTLVKAQAALALPPPDSANVVLVTIDGLRWDELFGGADSYLLNRSPVRQKLRSRYALPTAAARRRALMPFMWDSVGRSGQLLGNRRLGNNQDVANHRWVSYPGYNELLTGAPDDQRIRNNVSIYNPNETVLEWLNQQPAFAGRVAAFATWEAFPFILNQPRSGLYVDAGLNGHERPDSLTYQAARQYLLREQPRVLFLAFGNTDTFAHHCRYGDYLDAAHAIDGYLAELWSLLQSLPHYRGRTTLLITTDHGRGRGPFWTQHGRGMPASAHTWLAALGPGIEPVGEVSTPAHGQQTQVAGLLARSLGLLFPAPAGAPAPVAVITAAER